MSNQCTNVSASLDGQECPAPLSWTGVGAFAVYRTQPSNQHRDVFDHSARSTAEFCFPIDEFNGFQELEESLLKPAEATKDHTIVLRYLDATEKVIRTHTLTGPIRHSGTERPTAGSQPVWRIVIGPKKED